MGNTHSPPPPPINEPAGFGRDYGSGRVPLSLKRYQMSPELLSYLRKSCEIFSCSENQIKQNPSFQKCIDYPSLPNHRYYEGYMHGEKISHPVQTLNPRYGTPMEKQPAPITLRALCECVRRKLSPCLLKALAIEGSSEGQNEVTKIIIEFIEKGYLFSDLAIQIHAGDAVSEEHIGWHTDAPNSLLHMALTIGDGVRALHSKRSLSKQDIPCNHIDWQYPGSVYISSPSCFEHGVQYNRSFLWSNRIIAIQARFPVGDNRLMKIVSETNGEQYVDLMERISNALAFDFEMPSLAEVQHVVSELEELQKKEIE